MVPDSVLNSAFFVVPGSSGLTIESFNGLAFNTYAGQLVLIGGNFVH